MSEPTPDQDKDAIAAARIQLKAAFSPETPDDIRERMLDAVLAVLSGNDDD